MNSPALGVIFLAVALVNLVIYTIALERVRRYPRRLGLVRTAACRVFAALCYIGVALATIIGYSQLDKLVVVVLIAVSLTWQANSVLDMRLARRTSLYRAPKHYRPRGKLL